VKKRGQITLAIFLVVLVIIVLGVVIYFNGWFNEKGGENAALKVVTTPVEMSSVRNYVDSCITEVTAKSLEVVGRHGGYIDPKGNSTYLEFFANYTSYNGSSVPYYIISSDASYRIPLEQIIEKLRRFTVVELSHCLNFSDFELRGYNISMPEIDYSAIGFDFSRALANYSTIAVNVTVQANRNDVGFAVQYPIKVSKKDMRTILTDFGHTEPIPLKAIYQNATVLVNEIVTNQPYNVSQHCEEYSALSRILFLNNSVIRLVAALPDSRYQFDFAIKDTPFLDSCN
jgi:uncharacterized protein (UPF0333 family)